MGHKWTTIIIKFKATVGPVFPRASFSILGLLDVVSKETLAFEHTVDSLCSIKYVVVKTLI